MESGNPAGNLARAGFGRIQLNWPDRGNAWALHKQNSQYLQIPPYVHYIFLKIDFEHEFQIDWSPAGDAIFHDICWKAVLDSLRMDNPFSLSSLEKSVIAEAKLTAEYFDSLAKLDMEASRIVEMLKSAEYAIAFTGMSLVF